MASNSDMHMNMSDPALRLAADTHASTELDVSKESDDVKLKEEAIPQGEEPEGGALGVRAVIGAFGIR